MKTSIIEDLFRLGRQRPRLYSAIAPRSYITTLLVLALLWSVVFPFRAHANRNRNAHQSALAPSVEAAAVRHAPIVNGRVEGSVRQLLDEDVTLNSRSTVTGDLLVPGSPTIRINGIASFGGTVNGNGSIQPTGYFVTLKNGSSLGRLVKRTDPIRLVDVSAPPASLGTRSVSINSPGQSAGNFATLRDLTLLGNAGLITVPPGTYRNFTASGGGFVLGVPGATQPTVYNLNQLTVTSGSQL